MVVGSNRTQGNFLYTTTHISFDESAEKVIKIMFDWLSNIHFYGKFNVSVEFNSRFFWEI